MVLFHLPRPRPGRGSESEVSVQRERIFWKDEGFQSSLYTLLDLHKLSF